MTNEWKPVPSATPGGKPNREFRPELGYLFDAKDKGIFSPNVGRVEYTPEDAAEHNELLAEMELSAIRATGRAVLYLTGKPGEYEVTNWVGSMRLKPWRVRKGRHNIAGTRYDVWFNLDGATWHGVQYGENTQIVRCKRLKQA